MPIPAPLQEPGTFLLIALAILAIVAAIAVVGYFVLRFVLTRAADRVADQLARGMLRAGNRVPSIRRAGPDAPVVDPRELARLERLSKLLDSVIKLPVVGGVGLDALLGLVPVAGDVTSAAIGVGLIARAVRLGAPRSIVAQMVANVCVDLALGALPVVGDIGDVFFRANQKNMQLLREHLRAGNGGDGGNGGTTKERGKRR
ncbi:MAG TPA: DUF4112 domain-containing protein [Vicinamibacterales bacterium]|jgi:hypothetical protein|nr:DUF4112 domain-containing protein [Vicinamibacterales bacterium]